MPVIGAENVQVDDISLAAQDSSAHMVSTQQNIQITMLQNFFDKFFATLNHTTLCLFQENVF